MPPDITLFISPNEMQYERGADYINYAIKRKDDIAYTETAINIAADLRFEHPETGRCLNIEVKLAKDAIQSTIGGHLGQQVMNFSAREEPAVIVVWGSSSDIFQATSKTGPTGYRNVGDQLRDYNRYQAFKYDAWAKFGIPTLEIPFVKSSKGQVLQHPVDEIMKLGITFMRGGNIIRHLSKKDGMEVGAGVIARVPTVGQETAEALVKFYGDAGHVVAAARYPRELGEIKINGRKLGKKAEALHQAFWGVTA